VIEAKWGPEYKVFSHENGLNFSKKVSIFPKFSVSPKLVFTFYAGFLMHRSLEVSPGCMLSAGP